MKTLITIILFFCIGLIYSQNPAWNSKLVVKHPTGIMDTVWFGLDVNAANGFQSGLDSLNTDLVHPISILAQDELVRQEFNTPYCGNLKRDYKAFKTGVVEYFFYLKSDSFPGTSQIDPVEIIYDSLDFYYNYQNYKITMVRMYSDGGYFSGIDNDMWDLYWENDTITNSNNIVPLIYEYTPWDCSSNDMIIEFRMEVWISQYVGIEELESAKPVLCPNPSTGQFNVAFTKGFKGRISISDFFGRIVYEKETLDLLNEINLDISEFPKGMYFLNTYNSINEIVHIEKIILN
ncbi:MAG: T9SS type A sorting domain-containing protein [Bacteroidetes bacterium]|nr:T9SS type A sorting domain-containing protein [Bacteroidota bacterium]HET6244227.1 T9SS type A sorting domain-containing protein [Bacteroidia bacterium]